MKLRPGSLFALAIGLLALPGHAADQPRATDDDMRIRGVFDSALPGTERKNSLRLILHPHLGDLRDREHLRTALGARYGLTSRWEATLETDWYLAHGLKQAPLLRETGFSSWHFGSKYNLGTFPGGWESSVGADCSRPIGNPPSDLTDGLRHITPYVTFSRQLVRWPEWRTFCGVGYDFVDTVAIGGRLRKNQLAGDSLALSGGILWTRGPLTCTLEGSYNHPASPDLGEVVTIRPGFVWVVPQRYTFGSQGKWLLGCALRLSEGPDGSDVGINAKIRVNFDFKRLIGRHALAPFRR